MHPSSLYFASKNGNVEEVKEILGKNPNLNVNWGDGAAGWTALRVACDDGHDSIVSILLIHPEVDVNLKDSYGNTPFIIACANGCTSSVRLLLKDPRAKLNEPGHDRYSPLWCAVYNGHLDVVKWWIASGRVMDLGIPKDPRTDAIEMAMYNGPTEVVTLLENFKGNQEETRHQVRLEIGWYNEAAAEMFAVVVFISDELLQPKEMTPASTARFFNITRRLPLELQMVLCHRVVRSAKDIIQGQDSEVAFRSLAKNLLWSSIFTD